MIDGAPWYVATTYLIYILVWCLSILGGCAYVVFWRQASGWWFIAAVFIASLCFSPAKWHALFDKSLATQILSDAQKD